MEIPKGWFKVKKHWAKAKPYDTWDKCTKYTDLTLLSDKLCTAQYIIAKLTQAL